MSQPNKFPFTTGILTLPILFHMEEGFLWLTVLGDTVTQTVWWVKQEVMWPWSQVREQ